MPGGGGGTQTTKTEPWSGIQPYLLGTPGKAAIPGTEGQWINDEVSGNRMWQEGSLGTAAVPGTPGLYDLANQWFQGSSPMYYPGQTIAGLSPETQQAQQMQTDRATAGSPTLRAGENELTSMLSGNYLNANPYLDQMFGRASDAVRNQYQNITTPTIASRFGMSGRTGSGAEQEAYGQAQRGLGDMLGNLATDIYGGNYQQERNRMMQGLTMAPGMAEAGYMDIGRLGQVGTEKEAYNQQLINEAINKYNFGQNLPLNKLQAYNSILSGGMSPGFGTQTQPLYRNQAAGAMGGAMGGAGLASMMGLMGPGIAMSPWALPLMGGMGLMGALQ